MAERHSFWPPGLRAVAARRSKALSSSAPPCQISPHAPTRPGSTCRNDAGMMSGCGEHASGTAAHSQGRSRLSREGRGSGRVRESRGLRRARGKVGLYFITGIKETQNGTRAARTRALASPQHSHSKSKMRAAARARVSSIKRGTAANLSTAQEQAKAHTT